MIMEKEKREGAPKRGKKDQIKETRGKEIERRKKGRGTKKGERKTNK